MTDRVHVWEDAEGDLMHACGGWRCSDVGEVSEGGSLKFSQWMGRSTCGEIIGRVLWWREAGLVE